MSLMSSTDKARNWLSEKSLTTRDEAEAYLRNLGENPDNLFWEQGLDSMFGFKPEGEISTISEGFELGGLSPQQERELEQEVEGETSLEQRVSTFVRRLLRGIFGS